MTEQKKSKKKWYKRWWFQLLAIIAIAALVVHFALSDPPYDPTDTCEKLSSRIIELSEGGDNTFKRTILKLYDITIEDKSETQLLNCSAVAKFNRGANSKIRFYIEADKDGDQFYGYEPY